MSSHSNPTTQTVDFLQLELSVELPSEQKPFDFDTVDETLEHLGGKKDEFAVIKDLFDDSENLDESSGIKTPDEFDFTKEFKFSVADPKNPGPSWTTMPLVEIKVRTVDRMLIPPRQFHVYMDNVTEDFLQFSVAVFTNDGLIKESLLDRASPESGSGVWGSEINCGKFAYIETLRVSPEYQRQGIGRWAIESVLKSPYLADCSYFFTWATP